MPPLVPPPRLLVRGLLAALIAVVVGLGACLASPVAAAGIAPTAITLAGPPASAGAESPLTVDLTAGGAPLAGAPITIERRTAGAWAVLTGATTDAAGRAQVLVTVAPVAADNTFRASYAGDATYAATASAPVTLGLKRLTSKVVLSGPGSVVEDRDATYDVTWTAQGGAPVAGALVLRRLTTGGWLRVEKLRTDESGRASVTVAPTQDTRYRVDARSQDWVEPARSRVRRVRLLPSGTPVRLPRASPRPRITLPPQPHAVGDDANPVVTAIPDGVWSTMVGRSWHQGCPVGRAGLRLIRVNYWDYDGFRRRGELVVATSAAGQIAGAVAAMYAARLPIRSMYLVDRFGWSPRLDGADDYRSMAAGNTSAFNCRSVVNRPGVRSPHSYGRALDVNTWENPYRSATGLVPNAWWQSRSHPLVAWRASAHPVVRLMAAHGLRWTYGLGDTQHFDAVGSAGRVLAPRTCAPAVCD